MFFYDNVLFHEKVNYFWRKSIFDEKIVILPAVQLDVLIFHASKADINGNIQIGRRRELATLAHASKKVYVTVEEIVDEDFFDCELKAAATLPSLYVDGISLAKNGAWPCGLTDYYDIDSNEMSKYAKSAKYQETFDEYIRNFISQNYYSNIWSKCLKYFNLKL